MDLKSQCKCRKCSQFGHWAQDHGGDGKLPAPGPSLDDPLHTAQRTTPDADKIVLHFKQA